MKSGSFIRNFPKRFAGKEVINVRVVILILLLGCITSFSKIVLLNNIYDAMLMLYCISLLFICRKLMLSKFEIRVMRILVLMSTLRIMSMFYSEIIYSLIALIQLVTIFVTLLACSHFEIRKSDVNFINVLLLFVCALGYFDYNLSSDKISFIIFGSMNTLAGVFLFLFALNLVLAQYHFKLWHLINFGLNLLLILLSSSRTPLLSIGVFLICLLILNMLSKSVKKCKVFFLLDVAIIFTIIFLYSSVDKWTHFNYLNQLSQKLFNKNIDSGRPQIWLDILQRLKGHWIFGLGYIEQDKDYSAHNQFLQLLGDNGIVGLFLFLVLYIQIWNKLAKYSKDKVIRVIMSFMVVFLVYNCFEVALLQNKFALACLQWFIIAIGLNRANSLHGAEYRNEHIQLK